MQRPKIILVSIALVVIVGAFLAWKFLVPHSPVVAGEILPAGIPVEGPASSTVTIVEFLDFQCPSCGAFHPVMKRIREEYAGRIRYAQRMFPIVELHKHAHDAAIAAVCASRQTGKYFDYADALMANQDHLTHDDFIRYADALHLDAPSFTSCLADPTVSSFVDSERDAGAALGVQGTPWLFLNRTSVEGTPNYQQLKQLIDQALAH